MKFVKSLILLLVIVVVMPFFNLAYCEETKKDGVYKDYHENGTIKSEISYKDGLYHGPFKEYYENGVLWQEGIYKEGQPKGIQKTYFESGNLQVEMDWTDWDDRMTKTYYENGQLQSEVHIEEGKLISKKEYDKDGKRLTKSGKVVAVVLGEKIYSSEVENDKITYLIFGPLLEEFDKEHDIEPTGEEIQAYNQWLSLSMKKAEKEQANRREELLKELKSKDLDDEKRGKLSDKLELYEKILSQEEETKEMTKGLNPKVMLDSKNKIARHFIKSWKRNKSLYEEYGGRVIFQQAGPEPLDAYREFLTEHSEKGSFEIYDTSLEELFWKYYVDEMHNFLPEKEGKMSMTTPLWQLKDNNIENK